MSSRNCECVDTEKLWRYAVDVSVINNGRGRFGSIKKNRKYISELKNVMKLRGQLGPIVLLCRWAGRDRGAITGGHGRWYGQISKGNHRLLCARLLVRNY